MNATSISAQKEQRAAIVKKQKIHNFCQEYKMFLEQYMLPLLGMPSGTCVSLYDGAQPTTLPKTVYFDSDEQTLLFSDSKLLQFKLFYPRKLEKAERDETESIAFNVVQAFFVASEYNFSGDISASRNEALYSSDVARSMIYQMAVQRGICYWMLGGKKPAVEQLIARLERWAVKTYEGKKVTFGFIINPNAVPDARLASGDWMTFMESDYAAVFTDSIHSLIELDESCNFSRFLSLTEDGGVDAYSLTPKLPIRFAHCIQKHVTGGSVGVFLLNNGDIIVSKKEQIRFIKRNLHWLNFSYAAFFNAASSFSGYKPEMEKLLEEIYATMLDVSLSHTGGIIAIVDNLKELRFAQDGDADTRILNQYDDLLEPEHTPEPQSSDTQGTPTGQDCVKQNNRGKELKLKRSIIQALIGTAHFPDLDRKLRSELTAMDGACILTTDGEVVAFGAIIRNRSGSAGGGRSAACEELSKYGLAIKISTDGYVELYINGAVCYAIK